MHEHSTEHTNVDISRAATCPSCDFIKKRIVELLNPKTQDENQARLHNAWSLFLELAEQCSLDEQRIKSKPLIIHAVLAELKRTLKRELEVGFLRPNEKWPPYAALLSGLTQDPPNWAEPERLSRIMGQSMRMKSMAEAIELLKHSCSSTSNSKIHVIDEICEYWVTDLRWAGHSSGRIYEQLKQTVPKDILNAMSIYPAAEREFHVLLPALGVNDPAPSSLFSPVPQEIRDRIESSLGDKMRNHRVGLVNITARDSDAAARLGRQVAERVLAVAAFMRSNREISVADPVVVIDSDNNVSEHQTALASGYPHRIRTKGANRWLEVAELVARNSSDLRAVDVALRHHWLSCSAPTIDSRIVNLWTAFEVLFADGSQATSVSVADTVSKMVAGQYARYYIRRLAIDLARSSLPEQAGIRKSLRLGSDDSDKKNTVPPEPLALVLASPRDNNLINELYQSVSSNPLLVRKLTRARRVFETPTSLASRVRHHSDTIAWQIYRIYRARNAIVHGRAEMPPTVAEPLLRHAHHYLSLAINQILNGLSAVPIPSLGGVIKHRRSMYEFVLQRLQDKDTNPSYRALVDPSWWDRPQEEPSLWEAAVSFCTTHNALAAMTKNE